ncbi:MAG: sigma-54-dependent Fis family transcriptional regulator [Myxococcaceae bacterium]|nr:sigma-54-dependent Fis family transcriptional regulator [Myxococcaceae bacterium]
MLALDLKQRGHEVKWCTTPEEALSLSAAEPFDTVLTDLNLRASSGLDLCRELTTRQPHLPVIVITGFGSIEAAVQSIRAGAYDFITKPFDFEALALTVERAVRHFSLLRELHRLRSEVTQNRPRFPELIGNSPPMLELFRVLGRAADSMTTILVTGESGVGKELVARAVHQASRRKAGPFIALNCGALPELLLESELFGHVRGAFTDARSDRPGAFREAHGGTLFLDEVGELPLALQPKLLRVLQERTVRPVGADRELPVDIRIVCATNADLSAAVAAGKFREDLYYRLDVVHLAVPPLRTRGTDVLLLAQAFLERLATRDQRPARTLSPDAAQRLLEYDWPGNVRELLNVLERAIALSDGPTLRLEDLPERMREPRAAQLPDEFEPSTLLPLAEMERRYILKVLALKKGNKRQTADALEVDRSTLYRKLAQYGHAGESDE